MAQVRPTSTPKGCSSEASEGPTYDQPVLSGKYSCVWPMVYKFLNINRRLMLNNSAWTARPLLLSLSSPRNTDQRTALRRRLDFWLVPRPSEFFILRNLPKLFQFEFQIFKIRLFVLSSFLKKITKNFKGLQVVLMPPKSVETFFQSVSTASPPRLRKRRLSSSLSLTMSTPSRSSFSFLLFADVWEFLTASSKANLVSVDLSDSRFIETQNFRC